MFGELQSTTPAARDCNLKFSVDGYRNSSYRTSPPCSLSLLSLQGEMQGDKSCSLWNEMSFPVNVSYWWRQHSWKTRQWACNCSAASWCLRAFCWRLLYDGAFWVLFRMSFHEWWVNYYLMHFLWKWNEAWSCRVFFLWHLRQLHFASCQMSHMHQ